MIECVTSGKKIVSDCHLLIANPGLCEAGVFLFFFFLVVGA